MDKHYSVGKIQIVSISEYIRKGAKENGEIKNRWCYVHVRRDDVRRQKLVLGDSEMMLIKLASK